MVSISSASTLHLTHHSNYNHNDGDNDRRRKSWMDRTTRKLLSRSKVPFRFNPWWMVMAVTLVLTRSQVGTCFLSSPTRSSQGRRQLTRFPLLNKKSGIYVLNDQQRDISDLRSASTVNMTTSTPTTTTKTRKQQSRSPLKMPTPRPIPAKDISNKSGKKYFVPAEDLERLQNSIDLVSLIECYDIPQFQRTGIGGGDSRASCLCPFHDDHNPSLKIDGNRGIFKCFSCGVGGNALTFVREYAKLHGTELSFLEAVKVLDDIVVASSSSSSLSSPDMQQQQQPQPRRRPILPIDIKVPMGARPPAAVSAISVRNQSSITTNSTQKQRASTSAGKGDTKRERILLANLHAAAFYEECLLSRLEAGSARTHLRARGINPHTVKAFAIGFAPESYFTGPSEQTNSWGDGSLVFRLRDRGFTPNEILDAGLAIRTKRGKRQLEKSSTNNETAAFLEQDYSTLMDRFRGRLVVPIFDSSGNHVLGFGGRILESISSGSDFKAAKYLNSPESVVFQKKQILFGQHLAEKANAIKYGGTSSSASTKGTDRTPRPLIIVEGYMDTISLWQAGVRETVASMGTALTLEQLVTAGKLSRKMGGRIVLCLDNDDAGIAAVERLCTGQTPILYSVTEDANVEIFVANLPSGVKDPAEYLEANQGAEEALDNKFRNEVIRNAQEWTEWYTNRLIASFDPMAESGQRGSFGQIFDSLAQLLSAFQEVDDRAKKASIMTPKLAVLTGKDPIGDSAILIQLESDLMEKAASILHTKSITIMRSLEVSDDFLISGDWWNKEPIVSKNLEFSQEMSIMEGPFQNDVMKTEISISFSEIPDLADLEKPFKSTNFRSSNARRRSRMKRPWKVDQPRKSLTNHVRGVRPHKLDDEWLGGTVDRKTGERTHLRYELFHESSRSTKTKIGPDLSVRFNHNKYHGTWTTSRAIEAGYTSSFTPPKNLDFLKKGTGSLIGMDEQAMSEFAEDLLLKLLVRFSEARRSLSESLQISEASGLGGQVSWSIPEKDWIFKCMVEGIGEIPSGIEGLENLSEMKAYLLRRPDLYLGALSATRKPGDERFKVDTKDAKLGQLKRNISDLSAAVDIPVDYKTSPTAFLEVNATNSDIIPAIGDDWADFAQIEGYAPAVYSQEEAILSGSDAPLPTSAFAINDDYLDSIPFVIHHETNLEDEEHATDHHDERVIEPERVRGDTETHTSGFLEAEFLASDAVPYDELITKDQGTLDYLFHDDKDLDIFTKLYADDYSVDSGSSEAKANWAAQDLYTILQYTSVWRRVQAGINYLAQQDRNSLESKAVGNDKNLLYDGKKENDEPNKTLADEGKDEVKSARMTKQELAEYCSPNTRNSGLRNDLNRIRTLAKANQRSVERIYSLIHADFSDQTAATRGYAWLGNVLRFNQMKMVEWNDVIEAKEGFRWSQEGLDELVELVKSDWNELSQDGEMWDWNRNVDRNHASHLADCIMGLDDEESPEEALERIESDWGLLVEDLGLAHEE